MKFALFAAAICVAIWIGGCGGGEGESNPGATTPPLAAAPTPVFVVEYSTIATPPYPNGNVQVVPPDGIIKIADGAVTQVEFLLFGYDKQTLTVPNFSPKDNPQLRHVFAIPSTFNGSAYVCGTGKFLSEVRVVTTNGSVASKLFEICPGTPLTVTSS